MFAYLKSLVLIATFPSDNELSDNIARSHIDEGDSYTQNAAHVAGLERLRLQISSVQFSNQAEHARDEAAEDDPGANHRGNRLEGGGEGSDLRQRHSPSVSEPNARMVRWMCRRTKSL